MKWYVSVPPSGDRVRHRLGPFDSQHLANVGYSDHCRGAISEGMCPHCIISLDYFHRCPECQVSWGVTQGGTIVMSRAGAGALLEAVPVQA